MIRCSVPADLRGKCFNCFSTAHRAAECRSRSRCFVCRELGHRSYNCSGQGAIANQAALKSTRVWRRVSSIEHAPGHRMEPQVAAAPASVVALRRLRSVTLVVRGLHGGAGDESGRGGGREMQFTTRLCPQLRTARTVPRPQATSSAPRRRTTPPSIVPSRGGLSTAPTRSRGLRRKYAELSQSPLSATSRRRRSTF
jgi:hypothetical protein